MKKKIILIVFSILLFSLFSLTASAQCVNLFDPSKLGSGTVENRGITYTYNGDGTFTLNGTATNASSSYAFILSSNAILIEPGTYVFGNFGEEKALINLKIIEDSTLNYSTLSPSVVRFDTSYSIRGNIIVNTSDTFDNVIIKPYLVKLDVAEYGTLDGYEECVAAYKSSTEYSTAFESQFKEGYQSGKAEGYALGAENGETVGYIDGYGRGYENYKLSTEFENLLASSFDEGYAEGVSNVEEDTSTNIMSVLMPIIVLDVGCIILVIVKSKMKKRYKK